MLGDIGWIDFSGAMSEPSCIRVGDFRGNQGEAGGPTYNA
jgi:hypothetical protein